MRLYRNEYVLKDGQKLVVRTPEIGNEEELIKSGATFGFGHIINLLNGYTGIRQLFQIVLAVLLA